MVWIHSSRLHVVLYSMLLVATPFLLLRNFLQPTILILTATLKLMYQDLTSTPVAAVDAAVESFRDAGRQFRPSPAEIHARVAGLLADEASE